MLPELYQTHFQKYLKPSDYVLLEILINLLQSIKQVNKRKAKLIVLHILLQVPVVQYSWMSLKIFWAKADTKSQPENKEIISI